MTPASQIGNKCTFVTARTEHRSIGIIVQSDILGVKHKCATGTEFRKGFGRGLPLLQMQSLKLEELWGKNSYWIQGRAGYTCGKEYSGL